MLRMYYGPDTYSRNESVTQLKHELDADGMLSANTSILDAARLELPELTAVCSTVPFLAAHRLVIVSDLLARAQTPRPRSSRSASAQAGSDWGELAAFLPSMPASTTLLLLDGAVRDDNPLLRALRPLAEVRRFAPLSREETEDWIRRRALNAGTRIEPRALVALLDLAGTNLWTLSGEVDKLTLYALGRAVTEADVRLLVAAAQESNVFTMVDAILDGRAEPALRHLRLLFQGGAAGPYLITMIARQYRQLIIVQDLMQARAAAPEISRAAELRSEGQLRRLQQQARRWSAGRLQAAYERVLAADLSIKRGETDEETALELLVAELALQRAR